jgi:chemotaxis protein CheC
MLNELQIDLLKEYVNVFIGKAASMLSEIANQRVILSVPDIEIISMQHGNNNEIESNMLFHHGHIVSSSMKFGNDFSGRALLIFPANKAKMLVDACMGEFTQLEEDVDPVELADTDFDVLKEISNILLNSVIGEFGNLLGVKLEFSMPDIDLLFVSENEQKMYLENDMHMLMLYTTFMLEKTNVEGVVIVALGMNSLNMVISKIDEVLGELNE